MMLAKKDLGKPLSDAQLEFILKNQSPEGWFPAYPYPADSQNALTYPTAIILWGLTEQLRHNLISPKYREKVQNAVNKGVGWILETRKIKTGNFLWNDCPNQPEITQTPSAGLDGTVILMLHKAAEANLEIPNLPAELKEIDSEWLDNLSLMPDVPLEYKVDGRCTNETVDGGIMDRTIRFSIPWSIIATVKAFPNGTDWQKAVAAKWLESIPIEKEYKGFKFGESEHLIGLLYLRENDLK
jgi:hypothetical protein